MEKRRRREEGSGKGFRLVGPNVPNTKQRITCHHRSALFFLMAATLNASEFVEACKEFVAKYSAHESTPELELLRESYSGWTLVEHPVSMDEITEYG